MNFQRIFNYFFYDELALKTFFSVVESGSELNMEIMAINDEYQRKNIFLVLTSFYFNRSFYDGILLFLYSTHSKTKYL